MADVPALAPMALGIKPAPLLARTRTRCEICFRGPLQADGAAGTFKLGEVKGPWQMTLTAAEKVELKLAKISRGRTHRLELNAGVNPYAALIGGVELMNRCKTSVRLDVPVFWWMCCRWVLVVVSPIPRSSAASLTLRPGAMASSVRSSLPVRP